jgi:hypothetical protein
MIEELRIPELKHPIQVSDDLANYSEREILDELVAREYSFVKKPLSQHEFVRRALVRRLIAELKTHH